MRAGRAEEIRVIESLFSVEGKVAVVTGGSSGIGEMIARGYTESGARVYICSRKADVCAEVAAELSKVGTCIALPADLASVSGIAQLAAALGERETRLDILVNNAGANWAAPFAEYPESGWDKVIDLNLKAIFYLTQKMTPLLAAEATREAPARIINVASIDGIVVPRLETYAYSASKAAVIHMTRVLAAKLASQHITVNAVAPGPFQSRMMRETLARFGDGIAEQNPLGRIGTPEDIAGVALFLASRAGAYVTGATIPVDGGIAMTR
jgi:NAD(P)-dependent dehydrogenase (short-subunit alcohol dehydrogenase family)